MAKREAAKEENSTGIDFRNNCNALQIHEKRKVSKKESIPSEDTSFLRGFPVRFKNRKWIVNRKLRDEGMSDIKRPYSTAVKRVDRRKLSRWDDEDPNVKKKS